MKNLHWLTIAIGARIYVKKKNNNNKQKQKWSSPLDTIRLGENTKGDMAPTKPTTGKRNL